MRLTKDIKQREIQRILKRVVEDGNYIQALISELDLKISTDSFDSTEDTINYLLSIITQLDSDSTVLASLLEIG